MTTTQILPCLFKDVDSCIVYLNGHYICKMDGYSKMMHKTWKCTMWIKKPLQGLLHMYVSSMLSEVSHGLPKLYSSHKGLAKIDEELYQLTCYAPQCMIFNIKPQPIKKSLTQVQKLSVSTFHKQHYYQIICTYLHGKQLHKWFAPSFQYSL